MTVTLGFWSGSQPLLKFSTYFIALHIFMSRTDIHSNSIYVSVRRTFPGKLASTVSRNSGLLQTVRQGIIHNSVCTHQHLSQLTFLSYLLQLLWLVMFHGTQDFIPIIHLSSTLVLSVNLLQLKPAVSTTYGPYKWNLVQPSWLLWLQKIYCVLHL